MIIGLGFLCLEGFELSLSGFLFISSYFVIFGIMLVCVCCDTDSGILGTLNVIFCTKLPAAVSRVLHVCIGERFAGLIEKALDRAYNYCCNERNPILQGFYLLVVLGAYGLIVYYGYPMLPCHYLPTWHRYTAFFAVLACLRLWWLACTVSPGVVTAETLSKYAHNYPCDRFLYKPGRVCTTTGIVKPARSKFCKLMGHNIARFDHFCPWLNQSVGQENYRYFLLFLAAHCLLLGYGSLGLAGLLASQCVEQDLFNVQFYDSRLGRAVPGSNSVVLQYLVFNNWGIFGVMILCAVMCVVLCGFLGYHLWLAAKNVTTNESYKWGELRQAHKRYERQRSRQMERLAKRRVQREKRAAWRAKREAGSQNQAAMPELDLESESSEEELMPFEPFPDNHFDRGILQNLWEVASPFSLRDPPVDCEGLVVPDPAMVYAEAQRSEEKRAKSGQEKSAEGGNKNRAKKNGKKKKEGEGNGEGGEGDPGGKGGGGPETEKSKKSKNSKKKGGSAGVGRDGKEKAS